jgi:site-specific recombinase XerD
MNLSNYKVSEGTHNGKNVIWIDFAYSSALKGALKAKLKVRWSASQKLWYASDNATHRQILGLEPQLVGKQLVAGIYPVNLPAFNQLIEALKLKGYSINTIRTYTTEFAALLHAIKQHPVAQLTPERIRSYMLYCISKLKLSESHLHSRMNAIKFYFEKVLKRPDYLAEIPRPKRPTQLPKVVAKTDVKRMLQKVTNIKHRVLLKLCYGMGLRVSELIELKITDVDSKRMQVHIRNAKGKKDRYVTLPETVLEELREYFRTYKPNEYLFEGQFGGKYSVRSAQAVFRQAMKKAKINKAVGIHGLRHSYATHLLESGTDISLIKELLGHKDIKTTLGYTHVAKQHLAKIKSPLDVD